MTSLALSLKQPWAALLVHGCKTIEVRKWPTARRGRILIHAAKVSDPRPEAWALVAEEFKEDANLLGGIIGEASLVDCVTYRSLAAFQAEQHMHLNLKEWFQPPQMYGFRFTGAQVLPFRRFPGWMRFFEVPE